MIQARTRFRNMMDSNGKTLIDQPYLEKSRMRPDFYCVEDKTYYIVIENRQAYHSRKQRIQQAILDGTRIKVVSPDGEPYPPKNPIRMEKFLGNLEESGTLVPRTPVPSIPKKEIARPISIALYPNQIQGLKNLAQELGGTVSGLVREGVGKMLEWNEKKGREK
jgi:hypothetical protein